MKSNENLAPIPKEEKILGRIYRSLESWASVPFFNFLISLRSQVRIFSPPYTNALNKATRAKMNPFSWTVDDWYLYSQFASAFFVVVAILSGRLANSRQSIETTRLKNETASANKRAAEANERTAQVYRMLGPRYVSPAEKTAFADAAKNIPKDVPLLIINEDLFSEEATSYKYALWGMLSEAGFKCERLDITKWPEKPFNLMTGGRMPAHPSIRLEVKSTTARMPWMFELVQAFDKVGINLHLVTATHPELTPDGGALIVVGSKPEPEFRPQPTR